VITSETHEQPKSNEQVYLMQQLVQELNGLYEPHHWTTQWRSNRTDQLISSMVAALESKFKDIPESKKNDKPDVEDSEWD
jgi:hypothetical protein